MTHVFFFVSVFFFSLPVKSINISMPMCPVSFNCPYLGPFKYPFYNVTDTQCGLIKVSCNLKGMEIQFGGRSYKIDGKLGSDPNSETLLIWNRTFAELVDNKSCEALMNNLIPQSSSPLLYSVSVPNITLFKCTKYLTSAQQTDAYFDTSDYKSYNTCKGYSFYYNYFNATVPRDLPNACQRVQLPVKSSNSPGLNETNIFSLLSSATSLSFRLSHSCRECHDNGSQCDDKNGYFKCLDAKNDIRDTERTPPIPVQDIPDKERTPIIPIQEKEGQDRTRIKILVIVGVVGFIMVLVIFIILSQCKNKPLSLVAIILCLKRITGGRNKAKYNIKVEMFLKNHEFLVPKRYMYSEVEKMTNSFKVKLGQGGFGVVYKGVLRNQELVAVKILSEVKGESEDFINEVESVGRTSHVNIVSLMGFCLEGRRRALIYEFMPNGSLEKFIYNRCSTSSSHLGWVKLHEISIGIARGLEYLHRGCSTRILHFDIKPHNILLDNDFCPKISDFGLAKLFRGKESKVSISHLRGTPGYIAPELFSRNFGDVSHKSDVYSYGIMILEMVGGRRNIEAEVDHTSEIYFPHWIYKKVELHEEQLGLHGILCDEENIIARKMIIVGLWCIQTNPSRRPTITRVLEMLEGCLTSLEIPPKPYLFSPSRSLGSSSTM